MSYSITYQERALAEYKAATAWYREKSELAAINFEIAVKEKIDILHVSPALYHKTHKRFHEVALRKYPFSIVLSYRRRRAAGNNLIYLSPQKKLEKQIQKYVVVPPSFYLHSAAKTSKTLFPETD